MTKEEEKAVQQDNEYFMYDESQVEDIFTAIGISLVAFVILVALFAWEVISL